VSETLIERMNPVRGGRWIRLPVTGAVGEDTSCSCIVCGLPRRPPMSGVTEGLPVEYLVQTRTRSETRWHGLHEVCWERSVAGQDDFDYKSALDAANKIIGMAADEAKEFSDELEQLRAVTDAAIALIRYYGNDGDEEYGRLYTVLADEVRTVVILRDEKRIAKERAGGTT